MPRYPLQGISALSQLTVDADKDWQTRGITNLKELAAAMAFGDLVARGPAGILVRIPAGPAGLFLTGAGAALPYWGPGGLYLNRYIPANIYSSKSLLKVSTKNISEPGLMATRLVANYDDDTDMERIESAINSSKVITSGAPDGSISEPGPMGSTLELLIDGFVKETAVGVQTDQTAAARSAAINDVSLCPFTAVNDKIYLGSLRPFSQAWINVTTNGAGNWTNSCYYWNGAWTAVVGEDGDTDFQAGTGWRRVQHTPQGDWALSIIQGMNLYWMKIETTNWVNEAAAPLAGQIFLSTV